MGFNWHMPWPSSFCFHRRPRSPDPCYTYVPPRPPTPLPRPPPPPPQPPAPTAARPSTSLRPKPEPQPCQKLPQLTAACPALELAARRRQREADINDMVDERNKRITDAVMGKRAAAFSAQWNEDFSFDGPSRSSREKNTQDEALDEDSNQGGGGDGSIRSVSPLTCRRIKIAARDSERGGESSCSAQGEEKAKQKDDGEERPSRRRRRGLSLDRATYETGGGGGGGGSSSRARSKSRARSLSESAMQKAAAERSSVRRRLADKLDAFVGAVGLPPRGREPSRHEDVSTKD